MTELHIFGDEPIKNCQELLFWALKRDVKFDPIRKEARFKKILETIQ